MAGKENKVRMTAAMYWANEKAKYEATLKKIKELPSDAKELTVRIPKDYRWNHFKALKFPPSLEYLRIEFVPFHWYKPTKPVGKLLSFFPNLTTLDIMDNCPPKDFWQTAPDDVLGKITHMKVLFDEAADGFLPLAKFKKLRVLILKRSCEREGCKEKVVITGKAPSVEALIVKWNSNSCEWCSEHLEVSDYVAKRFPNVKILKIEIGGGMDESEPASAGSKFKNLEFLSLKFERCADLQVKDVSGGLEAAPKLKYLSVEQTDTFHEPIEEEKVQGKSEELELAGRRGRLEKTVLVKERGPSLIPGLPPSTARDVVIKTVFTALGEDEIKQAFEVFNF